MKVSKAATCAAAASLLAIGGLGVMSTPAQAASPVQITKVYVNSPGSDLPTTNAKVNSEYTVIKNTGTSTQTMTGWTLRDQSNHVYKFGTFSLGAGKTVVLRTGKGTNSATTRFWGSSYYIWNNTGDTAYLRNAAGTTMDSCAWTTTAPGYKNC